MPASKIQNEAEVIRWFEEGRTYAEMCEAYRTLYNIETVPSMWGNFRRRHGLTRRQVRNDSLIPWAVETKHRHRYPVAMLRVEGRRRSGAEIRESDAERLDSWLRKLALDDLVVHYDPDTEEGFFYVKRRPGVDTDLVRVPEQKTTHWSAVD